MSLDELQRQWAAIDKKLDQSLRLGKLQVREGKLQKALSALDRLGRWVAIELVVNGIALFALVAIAVKLADEPRYLVSTALLAALMLVVVGSGIQQLGLLSSMTLEAPVLVLQERLERLKILRIRVSRWIFLLAPLVWLPLIFVFLRVLSGFDGYALFNPLWVAANLAFGVLFIPLALWGTRRLKDRSLKSPFLRRLIDDLGGKSLAKARSFLDEVERLERED